MCVMGFGDSRFGRGHLQSHYNPISTLMGVSFSMQLSLKEPKGRIQDTSPSVLGDTKILIVTSGILVAKLFLFHFICIFLANYFYFPPWWTMVALCGLYTYGTQLNTSQPCQGYNVYLPTYGSSSSNPWRGLAAPSNSGCPGHHPRMGHPQFSAPPLSKGFPPIIWPKSPLL